VLRPNKPAPPTRPETLPAKSTADEAAKPPPATPTVAADATPDAPSAANAAREAEVAKAATTVIDAFSNAFLTGQPRLTRDGKRVVFVSIRDGLPRLYVADAGNQIGFYARGARFLETHLK
jgi:hypothetical protein